MELGHRRARRRGTRVGAVVALVVVGVALAACEPEPYVGELSGPRLAMVGDSLTVGLHDAAVERFTSQGWSTSVTGKGGYTVRDHGDTIGRVAATEPDVAVIELGTNDVREIDAHIQTYEGYRDSVRSTLAMLRDVPCVVWVTTETTNGWWGPDGDQRVVGSWINLITRAELSASGRPAGSWFVADWSATSRDRHEYFAGPRSVHHSPLGDAAYLDLIDRTVAGCPGQPPVGVVDVVAGSVEAIEVAGWAAHPDPSPVWVRVRVDGEPADSVQASGSRPDVGRALPVFGANRGFAARVPAEAGSHEVCVWAGTAGTDGRALGCWSVVVSASPVSTTSTSTTSSSTTSTSTTTVEPPSTSTSTTVEVPIP